MRKFSIIHAGNAKKVYFCKINIEAMSKLEHDKLDYLVAIISDFAHKFSLTPSQAYRYLSNYKAIDFLIRNYDIEHTLSFENVVDDVSVYCRNRGGALA